MPVAAIALSTWILRAIAAATAMAGDGGDDADFFERRIRPLLADHCARCHGEERPKSGLRLDSRESVLTGGERGPAAVAGDPEASLLLQVVRRDGDLAMPPKSSLTGAEVAALAEWIARGLPWPAHAEPARTTEPEPTDAERAGWPFGALGATPPPEVRDASWPRDPLDRFVLAELEARGLAPAPLADRATWLRRATFDLTGLPPSAEELDALLADPHDDDTAFATVVDRLLASPAYGERMARGWLDVVRYTDLFDARSLGAPDEDPGDVRQAWRYRDWVVDAFNRDLPFSEFVQDQLAGDLRATDGGGFDARRIAATGVLALGDWGGGDADKEKLLTDIVDDQVNLVGRAFLGLTLGCARCHDHKFDPISQADYYGLAGIFFSSHILPDVGPKTAGPPMLRIPLDSREGLAARERHAAKRSGLLAALGDVLGGEPLATPVRDVAGLATVTALRGSAELPAATINGGGEIVRFSTLTLPPHSVSIHPAPGVPAAVVFVAREPLRLAVRGALRDGDAVCGDGVAWQLLLRRRASGAAAASVALASGAFGNGGAAEFGDAPGLADVALAPGDELQLEVTEGGNHVCDTTVVEWTLTDTERPREFALAAAAVAARTTPDLRAELPLDGAAFRFVGGRGGDRVAAARAALQTDPGLTPALDPLLAELALLDDAAPPPLAFAHGVAEGGVPGSPHAGLHDVALHVRGRYDRLGPVVARRLPRVLTAADAVALAPTGSGRRELARFLAEPIHPLVARVAVNRVWQHHFGTGLVATSGNFGRLGEPPSHPELLDWLAARFVAEGGSWKALHRRIVLSSTWRQSVRAAAATLSADPEDRLLGRFRPTRLDAEQLRDALLCASGELDLAQGGPATRDAASRRRALYLMTIRSDRTTFRTLFDAADPTSIVDRRDRSTVAPQALWLLNDDFVLDRADALARWLETAAPVGAAGPDDRVDLLHRRLFARAATSAELEEARGFLAQGALAEYVHVLLMSNEFATLE